MDIISLCACNELIKRTSLLPIDKYLMKSAFGHFRDQSSRVWFGPLLVRNNLRDWPKRGIPAEGPGRSLRGERK